MFLELFTQIPGMTMPGIYIAIVIFVFIFIILIQIKGRNKDIVKKKPKLGISGFELIYTDQHEANKKDGVVYSKILSSAKYNICGKPDYIFRRKNYIIPVELKSASIGSSNEPRPGDLMQLAAYFQIIEYEYGIKPIYGRLVYSDAMFIVKNTYKLRERLEDILEDMHLMLEYNEIESDFVPSFPKCRYCRCRDTVCEIYKG